MQPYFFPYIGYWQLLYHSNTFVLYDDAQFIKRGYINRNSILFNKQITSFTLPVIGSSQNKNINEISFSSDQSKFLRTIEYAYKKELYFDEIMPIIISSLANKQLTIESVCKSTIELTFDYLGIEHNILYSSSINYDRNLDSAGKLASICSQLNDPDYINSIGGMKLYTTLQFQNYGCNLFFLRPVIRPYTQPSKDFIPNLSFIDMLMRLPREEIISHLSSYEIIERTT